MREHRACTGEANVGQARLERGLNALEEGAADYCAAPFEPVQMRWLLQTHLGGFSPRTPDLQVKTAFVAA